VTLLDAEAVRAELGLKDIRSARRIMRAAGAFDLGGGRLRLDATDLSAWLEARRTAPKSLTTPGRAERVRRPVRVQRVSAELGARWWDEERAS
jgi:hypothetical protein